MEKDTQTIIYVQKEKTFGDRLLTVMNISNAFLAGVTLLAAAKFFKNVKVVKNETKGEE